MANQVLTFTITDTKLYILVITLSTQHNAKLLDQLNSGFKRTVNWNKYQSKRTTQTQNPYLDFLIDPSFQGVNSLFVLLFEDINIQDSYKRYFIPATQMKDYNVMIDTKKFFINQYKII